MIKFFLLFTILFSTHFAYGHDYKRDLPDNVSQQTFFRYILDLDFLALQHVLEHNQDLANVTDKYGRTPLHQILLKSVHGGIVALLIRHGADSNAQDMWGRTPLHIAVLSGNGVLAQVLLDTGCANQDIEDNDGLSPADMVHELSELSSLVFEDMFNDTPHFTCL